jgi:hypothetical protein
VGPRTSSTRRDVRSSASSRASVASTLRGHRRDLPARGPGARAVLEGRDRPAALHPPDRPGGLRDVAVSLAPTISRGRRRGPGRRARAGARSRPPRCSCRGAVQQPLEVDQVVAGGQHRRLRVAAAADLPEVDRGQQPVAQAAPAGRVLLGAALGDEVRDRFRGAAVAERAVVLGVRLAQVADVALARAGPRRPPRRRSCRPAPPA